MSPVLFTCFLSFVLKKLRDVVGRSDPPIACNYMPLEWAYADDTEFLDEEKEPLDFIYMKAPAVFEKFNLTVNTSKTEKVHCFLADKAEDIDNEIRGEEAWRKVKLLGSLLCTLADLRNRLRLGTVAFRAFWKMWVRRRLLSLKLRIRLYDALVVSVMLYNCSSWAIPSSALEDLDVLHRKHLRMLLGIFWPNIISNKDLYRKCQTEPLSERVIRLRRQMFGHVLRMNTNSPAQSALSFAVIGSRDYKARRGRHTTNLLNILRTDLRAASLKLQSLTDLDHVRSLAKDRVAWKKIWQ